MGNGMDVRVWGDVVGPWGGGAGGREALLLLLADERVVGPAADEFGFVAVELALRRLRPAGLPPSEGLRSVAEPGCSASPSSFSPSSLPAPPPPEMERPPGTFAGPPAWEPGMLMLEERPIGVPTGIEEGSWP